MITAALRDLDPAPETVLTEAERERSDATLARILATPGDAVVPVEPDRPRRRRSRLLVPVGLAGAAGAAGAALLLGGGSAYASWTPTPEPLAGTSAASAAVTCRDALAMPIEADRALIAERRGEWTYVLIAGPKGEGTCLMPNDLVGQQRSGHEGNFFGQGPDAGEAPTLPRGGIDETTSMQGATHEGWFDKEGWFTWVQGYVGSEVTGVTVHTPSGLDVEASVHGGRFAAWWPGGEVSADNPELHGAWTYTVTLADGSTRRTTG
ncbi:hypothetical protein [Actinopolymorpha cephalotaxi]|nr:hypothetical protein [Actinopolymorpha cephalotaxi]NYH84354.1 hypothetical protein [Actinopolymorpha cephalotaxi]